jgi:hypothetical protein
MRSHPVSLSADGRVMAFGKLRQNQRIWEVETGRCLRTLTGHSSDVDSVWLSPDGRLALSGGYETTLRLWEITPQSQEICTLQEAPTKNIVEQTTSPVEFTNLLKSSEEALAARRFSEALALVTQARTLPEGNKHRRVWICGRACRSCVPALAFMRCDPSKPWKVTANWFALYC